MAEQAHRIQEIHHWICVLEPPYSLTLTLHVTHSSNVMYFSSTISLTQKPYAKIFKLPHENSKHWHQDVSLEPQHHYPWSSSLPQWTLYRTGQQKQQISVKAALNFQNTVLTSKTLAQSLWSIRCSVDQLCPWYHGWLPSLGFLISRV